MPDTGNPYLLPYPDLSEEANAPQWFHDLAAAEHNALATLQPRSSRLKTVTQTLPLANTLYKIEFDTDDPAQVNTLPIPYSAGIWTIEQPGVYALSASAHIQFAGTNVQLRMGIDVSGLRITWPTVAASVNSNIWVSKMWRMVAGDTVQFTGYCSVANAVVYGAGSHYTVADVAYVAL